MVVVSVLAFELITAVATGFYTVSTERSEVAGLLRSCSEACYEHAPCGGFVWNNATSPPCQLVVEQTEAGAALSSSSSAYRLMEYGGKTLREAYIPTPPTWQTSADACNNMATPLTLITYATTPRDRAILTIRRHMYAYVDLKLRSSDGAYLDQTSAVADMTKINWSGSNPHQGSEICVGFGYSALAYFDNYCDVEDGPYDVFCLG